MQIKNMEEQKEWMGARGLNEFDLSDHYKNEVRFALPEDTCRRYNVARLLTGIYSNQEVIFLFKEEIWPSCSLEYIFCQFRSTASFYSSLEEYPFHILSVEEGKYLEGMLTLSSFSLWEVVIADVEFKTKVSIHHSADIRISSRDVLKLEEISEDLIKFGLRQLPS